MAIATENIAKYWADELTRLGKTFIMDMYSVVWDTPADPNNVAIADKVKFIHQSDILILQSIVGNVNRPLTEWYNDVIILSSGFDTLTIRPTEFAQPYPFFAKGNVTLVRSLNEPLAHPIELMPDITLNFIRIIETSKT